METKPQKHKTVHAFFISSVIYGMELLGGVAGLEVEVDAEEVQDVVDLTIALGKIGANETFTVLTVLRLTSFQQVI